MDKTDNLTISVKNLKAGYTKIDVLHGVDLLVNSGEIVSIIGPNGAGKSTLIKAIFGFLKIHGGEIFLNGDEITFLDTTEIVKKGISYVPQVNNIFPTLTIRENLEMGAFLREDDYENQIEEIYTLFPDLKERQHDRAGLLSGGQRQMVAMGRALMQNPSVLLLDEPTAGLSPLFVHSIFDKIKGVNNAGVTILMVEQNAKEAMRVSDRTYVLATGQNVMDGPSKALLENEEVGKLYLGG